MIERCYPRTGLWSLFLVCVSASLGLAQDSPPRPGDSGDQAPQNDPLLKTIQEAIDVSSRRILSTDVHTPWQIMHGVLAFRDQFVVKHEGQKINALEWIAQGPRYEGEEWFQVTRYGARAHPYTEPYAFQGHPGQFLAMLAMANLPRDFELQAGGKTVTIGDLVENAQMDVNDREEVTWMLWALSHYLDPEARWENKYGESWSIERMVRIQTRRSLNNAACGGTHLLFSLSYARNAYLETGKPLQGDWREADGRIQEHVDLARRFQNADGMLSSDYFRRQSYNSDFEERLHASGHTLEFLAMALAGPQLRQRWLRRAARAVAQDLIEHSSQPVKCGNLYHAVDGLVLYRDQVWPDAKPSAQKKDSNKKEAQGKSASEISQAEGDLQNRRTSR